MAERPLLLARASTEMTEGLLPTWGEALTGVVALAAFVILAVFVARDMSSRGRSGAAYALLVLVVPPVGVVVWLIMRGRTRSDVPRSWSQSQ